MNISQHSNVSFKGFDNVFATRFASKDGKQYTVSMRLNNEGENDLDKFSKVMTNPKEKDILTIHYEKPNGVNSFVNVNNFPLILDKAELEGADFKTVKEVEKASIPLAQNVVNLLKRVGKVDSTLRDSSLATYTAMDNNINAVCGLYKEIPGFKQRAIELLLHDNRWTGDVPIIHEAANNIVNVISNKMTKYFK